MRSVFTAAGPGSINAHGPIIAAAADALPAPARTRCGKERHQPTNIASQAALEIATCRSCAQMSASAACVGSALCTRITRERTNIGGITVSESGPFRLAEFITISQQNYIAQNGTLSSCEATLRRRSRRRAALGRTSHQIRDKNGRIWRIRQVQKVVLRDALGERRLNQVLGETLTPTMFPLH